MVTAGSAAEASVETAAVMASTSRSRRMVALLLRGRDAAIIAATPEAAMVRLRVVPLLLMLLFASTCAHAGGKLGVFDAWIRAAPPGATMMAGYATLKNGGDAPLTVLTVQSDAF